MHTPAAACRGVLSSAFDRFPGPTPICEPRFSAKSSDRGCLRFNQNNLPLSRPSITSRVRWLYGHPQNCRNMPGGRNDTCWQSPRLRPAYVPEHAGKCCSSFLWGSCHSGCPCCKGNIRDPSPHPPAALSLLSAVGGFPSSLSSVFCVSPLVARPADPTRHYPHKPELAKLPSARRRKLATACRPRQE